MSFKCLLVGVNLNKWLLIIVVKQRLNIYKHEELHCNNKHL